MIGDPTVLDSLKLLDGDLFIPNGSNLIANSKATNWDPLECKECLLVKRVSINFIATFHHLWRFVRWNYNSRLSWGFHSDTTFFQCIYIHESIQGTRNDKFQEPDSASSNVNQGQGIWVFVFEDNEKR